MTMNYKVKTDTDVQQVPKGCVHQIQTVGGSLEAVIVEKNHAVNVKDVTFKNQFYSMSTKTMSIKFRCQEDLDKVINTFKNGIRLC